MKDFKKFELENSDSAKGGGTCDYYHGVWNAYYVAWHNNPIPENFTLMDRAYTKYINCVYGRTIR